MELDRVRYLDQQIRAGMSLMDATFFDIMSWCAEINNANAYYQLGFNSIMDYIRDITKNRYKDRMKHYALNVFRKEYIADLIHNNRELVENIGETKLILLASSKKVTEENLDEWVIKAQEAKTVQELKNVMGMGSGGDHPCTFHCNFSNKEDYEAFIDCIERIRRHTGTESTAELLNYLVAEVKGGHPELWVD